MSKSILIRRAKYQKKSISRSIKKLNKIVLNPKMGPVCERVMDQLDSQEKAFEILLKEWALVLCHNKGHLENLSPSLYLLIRDLTSEQDGETVFLDNCHLPLEDLEYLYQHHLLNEPSNVFAFKFYFRYYNNVKMEIQKIKIKHKQRAVRIDSIYP